MTCGKPIRDRSGEALPGVTCNLDAGHLGGCAAVFDFGHTGRLADMKRLMATVTPSEPSDAEPGTPAPSRAR